MGFNAIGFKRDLFCTFAHRLEFVDDKLHVIRSCLGIETVSVGTRSEPGEDDVRTGEEMTIEADMSTRFFEELSVKSGREFDGCDRENDAE